MILFYPFDRHRAHSTLVQYILSIKKLAYLIQCLHWASVSESNVLRSWESHPA